MSGTSNATTGLRRWPAPRGPRGRTSTAAVPERDGRLARRPGAARSRPASCSLPWYAAFGLGQGLPGDRPCRPARTARPAVGAYRAGRGCPSSRRPCPPRFGLVVIPDTSTRRPTAPSALASDSRSRPYRARASAGLPESRTGASGPCALPRHSAPRRRPPVAEPRRPRGLAGLLVDGGEPGEQRAVGYPQISRLSSAHGS